ncbi:MULTISPECIES: LacI family DNA-binding transcriptional regulator [Nocardioides]|uniref:LacI family DNA-binding transcriptional regulator n=1 Tax=Nocardioides vastitatis TaxID=2568655 RepID=A0ABW0ZH97_9ACTN|nr:LacI family DNA-binding transcriptional regulator [Nocardioides sp.]THI91282.1 LacI family DNA-binding transcriptional regulator [Nocardioides sp.]
MGTDSIAGGPGPRRGASQADVARIAGVSGQTVSRVANGARYVDAATRERVLLAMRTVGYRPNRAARALRTGRFQSIGVIAFELSSVGTTHTLDAIAAAAVEIGYAINLVPVLDDTDDAVRAAFNQLGEQAVDGIIILVETHRLDGVTVPEGLPVVVVDSSAQYDYPIVDNDQAHGARLATEHLLELGHETVWHVAGPELSFSARRRRTSWQATLEAHGRVVPPVLPGDWSTGSGYEAGLRLAGDEQVTAVFTANDQMALGLLRALHEQGRRVPEDVSVVGFDDMEEAAYFWPPLTTVHQSFDEVGRRAVDTLIREIHSTEHEEQEGLVPTRLVVRASTAPPRSTTA